MIDVGMGELEFVLDSEVCTLPYVHTIFNIKWQSKVAKGKKLEPVQSPGSKALYFGTLHL